MAFLIGCASREELIKKSTQQYEYGLVYLEKGNLARAYEEFEKARGTAPENDRAYFGLGLIYYFQGHFEKARSSYKKAIELNPQVPEYYNNMAAVLAKLGRWKDVIQYCQVALEYPNYSTPGFAYYNMGCAYMNLGELRKSYEFLQRSKEENNSYIDTHLQLGKVLFKLGDVASAIISFKEAEKLEADATSEDFSLQAEIGYHLAQSYLELGDIPLAKQTFMSVIEKAPGSKFAEESARYLKELRYY
ncbi:MAG: tetratricopeptide repeat protein [bacterium]